MTVCLENCTYSSGYSIFTSSGLFIVPCGVQQVRALAVGGGSGGMNSDGGGGGSGYVRSGVFTVTPLQWIPITVGTGGPGSSTIFGCSYAFSQNSQAGGTSSFGTYLSAAGGEGYSGNSDKALSGGSGGGAGNGCTSG